jgi:nuclear pore complex protein Nup53
MFQTPQSGTRDGGGGGQPISILFTPPVKSVDGQKTAHLGRSPSATPGGYAPNRSKDQTPPSRRRSLTPASSMARDTPPPPPGDSLLDSPGMAGPSLAPWGRPAVLDVTGGQEDASTSIPSTSAATAAAAAQNQRRDQHDAAAAARQIAEYDGTWVTVFGFGAPEVPLVLREFGKCGDIAHFGTFGDGPHVNWLHLGYSSRHAAQRALLRDGERLSASCMVGVKPVDPARRAAIERGLAGSGGMGPATAAALPRPATLRPYSLDSSAAQAVVPLSGRSTWSKVTEFVFGL